MNAAEMRREMLETVRTMAAEVRALEGLDEEAEDAVVRLRLHLTWLQGQFPALRRAVDLERVAMRRSLLRVGDHSLDPDEAEEGDRTRAVAGGVNTGGMI
jgi:hypothetical protein